MNDFTFPSAPKREEGQNNYFSQMIEIEYGLTEQLAVEIMGEGFEELETGRAQYTGQRYEARYRLSRKEVPLNPMVYVEYEDLSVNTRYKMEVSGWINPPYETAAEEEAGGRESILESRLILSQDVGKWNFAFNWINESDIVHGGTAFGYSFGTAYHSGSGHGMHKGGGCEHHPAPPKGEEESHREHQGAQGTCVCKTAMPNCKCAHCKGEKVPCSCEKAGHHGVTYGIELFGGVGDNRSLKLDLSRQEHYFQPFVMMSLGGKSMLHLAFAKGLSRSSDDIIRTSFAYEF